MERKTRVQTNRWENRVRGRIENNRGDSTEITAETVFFFAVACLSVCQCMCLIGFLPNWHVLKKKKTPARLDDKKKLTVLKRGKTKTTYPSIPVSVCMCVCVAVSLCVLCLPVVCSCAEDG